MKKGAFLILLLLLTTISVVVAVEIPAYKDKYVNDFAGMLSAGETLDLRNLLSEIDMNTTAEIAVVTMLDCGDDFKGFAVELASTWKIGKADKDNGLLILYCKAQNKLDVETGYGLEGILPDSKIGRYLDNYYVPMRDENKTVAGIIAFTGQMAQIIEENKAEVISGQAGGSSSSSFGYIILAIILFIAIVFILKFSKKKRELKTKSKKIGIKKNPIATFLDIATFVIFAVIFIAGFNLLLIVLLILTIILRAIIGGVSGVGNHGFIGSGFSGGSSGGFGGGFGGGSFGGGGASR